MQVILHNFAANSDKKKCEADLANLRKKRSLSQPTNLELRASLDERIRQSMHAVQEHTDLAEAALRKINHQCVLQEKSHATDDPITLIVSVVRI